MSERYTLFKINNLYERFHLTPTPDIELKRSYNISPTQTSAVIVQSDGTAKLELMKWGFIPRGAPDTNSVFRYKTFNARSEGIFSKPRWGEAIRHKRCLVPANGFYMWKASKDGKKPYYVRLKDQELFAMGGIYSSWVDPKGNEWGTYSLVTTMPNRKMDFLGDRMPVLLAPNEESIWLDPEASDINTIYSLLRPYPDDGLIIEPVSDDINSMKIDNPRLVTPLAANEN